MRETLFDDRLVLRRPRMEDIPAVVEAVRESIAEIHPWMAWCHPDYGEQEAATWISLCETGWSDGTEYNFLMTEPQTGTIVGSCGLHKIDRIHRYANLGYWVRTSRAGRGLATAATLLVAKFGLTDLGLQRIEIVAAVENTASRRVAEKVGAKVEGILRQGMWLHGRSHDAVMHSLVAPDLGL